MNLIEQLGNPERFEKTFCLDGLNTPVKVAETIKDMANALATPGYTISKVDCSPTLNTPEAGKIDNRKQTKCVFTFEKNKPTTPR